MNHARFKLIPHVVLFSAVIIMLCFLPGTSSAFLDGKIDKFSADQVELSDNGKIINTLKIYVTPKAFRMDGMPGAGADPDMPKTSLSMISLADKKEHYTLNHDKKLYCVTILDENNMPPAMKGYKDAKQIKELGTETVSGYKCIKKEVTTTVKMMGMTSTDKMLVWESDRFDMPLRVKAEEGYTSEIRNIKKGAPADSLFTIPKGYTKVDNIMLVMGMDFGKMGSGANSAPDEDDNDPQDQEASQEELNKALKGLGDKLKNFKLGQ